MHLCPHLILGQQEEEEEGEGQMGMAGGLKAAVAECKAAKKAEARAGGRDRWMAGIEP